MPNVNVSSSPSNRSAQLQQSRAQVRRSSSSAQETSRQRTPLYSNRTQPLGERPNPQPRPLVTQQNLATTESDQAQTLRQSRSLASRQQAIDNRLRADQAPKE